MSQERDVAPFPEPPKYWKFYDDAWQTQENLQPPKEPKDGKWRFLGTEHELNETRHVGQGPVVGDWSKRLESMAIEWLVPPEILGGPSESLNVESRREALQELNHALVFNFLELLDILARDPGPVEHPRTHEHLNRMRTLLHNLHGGLNALRPHQARATLAQLLHNQIDERNTLSNQVDKVVDDIEQDLKFAGTTLTSWLQQQ